MHAGNLELSPAGGSGWDSFPSGHAAAAIAVATVLATKFPRARWPILAAAVVIAASRIFRGSHYLTDVAGGAALGCVMGAIAVHPWREWRAAAGLALCRMTPYFVVTLAFVWTINVNPDASITFVYTEPQTAPEPRLGRVVWRPDNTDDIPDLDGFVERLVSHQRARIASLADDSQADLFERYKALLAAGLADP